MAQTALVNIEASERLIRAMDAEGVGPLAALWVYSSERDRWRLWLVPKGGAGSKKQRENYLRVAEIMNERGAELAGLDIGDIEFVDTKHPAVSGLSSIIKVKDGGHLVMEGLYLNDFYLPDSIVMRMQ